MMTINNGKNTGLYIHIPFCERKCDYCGFLSFPMTEKEREIYVDYIIKEIYQKGRYYQSRRKNIDTIFIGGGTPSLLTEKQITDILKAVDESFKTDENAEITLESNPNSLTEEKCGYFYKAGINRLSIGIQSFNDDVLEALNRIHDSEQAVAAFKNARKAGFDNINIDLMFGVPGQDMDIWENTLQKALALEPEHISFYGLQIEPETVYYERYKREELPCVSDAVSDRMYLKACEVLKNAGYIHYEISNAAKPKKVCRHNLKYWNMEDFIAVGPGASAYVDGYRSENPADLQKWRNSVAEGNICSIDPAEKETINDAMAVFCFTALRTVYGIDTEKFKKVFGQDFYDVFADAEHILKDYEKEGYLIFRDGHIVLTEKGFLISNEIMCEFV